MSELFDKQVNAQKEKDSRGLMQAHEKACNENKTKKKNDTCIKMLLMERSTL